MKIPAIKKAAEAYTMEQLRDAEAALYEEQNPVIDVDGTDEGEVLTHVLAAIWIKEEMEKTGQDLNTCLRAYTQRVRNSIS